MKTPKFLVFTAALMSIFSSCQQQLSESQESVPLVVVKTTIVNQGEIEKVIQLNGQTIYLQKNKVLAPIAGYLISSYIKLGDRVKRNDLLFQLQTKENKALENKDVPNENQAFINVRALSDGIIDELNVFQTGMYVLEGDFLCNIIENNDLMVQVNVPFEYNALLNNDLKCKIQLPDQSSFSATLHKIMPTINASDQTQTVLLRPENSSALANRHIPENLNLVVEFVWMKHADALLVSKMAIMTNETQQEFWVMKVNEQQIAIKIPIQKGIENESVVEIISNKLKKNDVVVQEGAYSLADSTAVTIDN